MIPLAFRLPNPEPSPLNKPAVTVEVTSSVAPTVADVATDSEEDRVVVPVTVKAPARVNADPAQLAFVTNASRSAFHACTSVPITTPRVVLPAAALASSINDRPNDVRAVVVNVAAPVAYSIVSAAITKPEMDERLPARFSVIDPLVVIGLPATVRLELLDVTPTDVTDPSPASAVRPIVIVFPVLLIAVAPVPASVTIPTKLFSETTY